MSKLRTRLAISSALLLAAAVLWRAAFGSDADRGSASLDSGDEGTSAPKGDVHDLSSVRSGPARVESGHLPRPARQPVLLDHDTNDVNADGAAGGPAAPPGSPPHFRWDGILAGEKPDEIAADELTQKLTAVLNELHVRGTLTSVRCGSSICEAMFEFADLAEAGRYSDAASQDGRWREAGTAATSDEQYKSALKVYIEPEPRS